MEFVVVLPLIPNSVLPEEKESLEDTAGLTRGYGTGTGPLEERNWDSNDIGFRVDRGVVGKGEGRDAEASSRVRRQEECGGPCGEGRRCCSCSCGADPAVCAARRRFHRLFTRSLRVSAAVGKQPSGH